MKIIVSIVLIALLSFAIGLYLPWWSLAIAAFLIPVFINQKPGWAFISGFTALFLLWGMLALTISADNSHLFAHKISLLILKSDSPMLLVFVTALLGALVAGLAALSGSLLRKLIVK